MPCEYLTWSSPERYLSSEMVPVTAWVPCFDMSWVEYLLSSVKAGKVLAMCTKPLYLQKLVNSSFIHLLQLGHIQCCYSLFPDGTSPIMPLALYLDS